MAWRISYSRGAARIRVRTIEDATQDEVAALLRKLAANQFELEYLGASDTSDRPKRPEVRANRNGTMFWTTGNDFHYTADWKLSDDDSKRKRDK